MLVWRLLKTIDYYYKFPSRKGERDKEWEIEKNKVKFTRNPYFLFTEDKIFKWLEQWVSWS